MRAAPQLPRLTVGVLVIAAVLCVRPAAAQTVVWNGGTGVWDLAGNWLPAAVPGAANDVIINVDGVHTVTVRSTGGPFTVNSVNMNGGDETLAITTGSLTLLGDATADNPTGESVITNYIQSGGTLSGPGSLTITGTAGGLVLSLNGAAVLLLGLLPGGLMAMCVQAIVKALAT